MKNSIGSGRSSSSSSSKKSWKLTILEGVWKA